MNVHAALVREVGQMTTLQEYEPLGTMRVLGARLLLMEVLNQRTHDVLTSIVWYGEVHRQVVQSFFAAFQSPVPSIGLCQAVALALTAFIATVCTFRTRYKVVRAAGLTWI